MSRTDLRRWLILGVAAFALRAGVAVLTEYKPLFPAYYYHDAVFAEKMASDMSSAWREGRPYRSSYSAPQRIHAFLLAVPYLVVGEHPFVGKLLASLLGGLSVVFFGLAASAAVSPQAGFAAAAMTAAWPSHVFFTSQNFKESPTFALVFGALALILPSLASRRKANTTVLLGFLIAAVGAGLLRAYVLMILSVAVAVGAALSARRGGAAGLILAAALFAPIAYKGASRVIFTVFLRTQENLTTDNQEADFARTITNEQGVQQAPFSPRSLSEFRRLRQAADRSLAEHVQGREIGTQIYPEARFNDWFDVAAFFPKSYFQVLFMPLPGLYAIDGKLGRLLASLENVVLLVLFAVATWRISRDKISPGALVFITFFILMSCGTGLLEFDLGSASRHKLLYFPMIFPFAVNQFLRKERA